MIKKSGNSIFFIFNHLSESSPSHRGSQILEENLHIACRTTSRAFYCADSTRYFSLDLLLVKDKKLRFNSTA